VSHDDQKLLITAPHLLARNQSSSHHSSTWLIYYGPSTGSANHMPARVRLGPPRLRGPANLSPSRTATLGQFSNAPSISPALLHRRPRRPSTSSLQTAAQPRRPPFIGLCLRACFHGPASSTPPGMLHSDAQGHGPAPQGQKPRPPPTTIPRNPASRKPGPPPPRPGNPIPPDPSPFPRAPERRRQHAPPQYGGARP